MSTAKEVKLQLLDIAARIVAPIVDAAASKVSVAIDPTVQDAQLRTLNLFAFEELQVQYNALKLAFEDNTANEWPDPVVASATSAPTIPTPTAPIPSPGANLSGVAQVAGTIAQVAGAVAGAVTK